MNRNEFITQSMKLTFGASLFQPFANYSPSRKQNDSNLHPLAITMWDFSWLERRWLGAGYENWETSLKELVQRGYNAVRIDAYPHLLATNAKRKWRLKPVWTTHDWGSPVPIDVEVQSSLFEFIELCEKYEVKVGLSSWYREDVDNVRMQIDSPDKMAKQWILVLQMLDDRNLLKQVFYVDLCNEFPGSFWAPYFHNQPPELTWGGWYTETAMNWMKSAVSIVQENYPQIPIGISFEIKDPGKKQLHELSYMDYFEPHIWMVQQNNQQFYRAIDYQDNLFTHVGYELTALEAIKMYHKQEKYWQQLLIDQIVAIAELSKLQNMPLMTTECWAMVNYKDFPGLDWKWIKDLCGLGLRTASKTGQWVAISSSNFCGPQFRGMWQDIDLHLSWTDYIKAAEIDHALLDSKLLKRIHS